MITLFCLPAVVLAQEVPVHGTVRDQANNEPMAGVSVQVKGTTRGTTTDSLGRFTISVPGRKSTLVFSYAGYAEQELSAGQGTLTVLLASSATNLNEVVVVGYGTQKRKDITGSVVSIDKQRLENMPNTNFAQALEGSVPGVAVTTTAGGAEGQNVKIMVRGRKSITADTDPLIVLDGIPYGGSFSDINTNDIASMEILKDASAAAIYGSRASNGVILITTKRGSSGKPVISFDGYTGMEKIANLPKLLTPQQFYAFKVQREGQSAVTTSEQAVYDSGKFPDWVDLATQTGQKTQGTISIRGGSNSSKFYASLNYTDVKGVAVNDHFKALSTRVNLETNVTKWLTYGTNTQLTYDDRAGQPASFGGEDGAYLFNPLTTAFDSAGNLTINPWPQDVHFGNPLAPTLATSMDNTYKIFSANYLQVKVPFVPGLGYRLNTGIEHDQRRLSTYYGRNTLRGLAVNGDLTNINKNTNNYTIENILTYDHEFGKHTIGFTGLYSFEKDVVLGDTLYGQKFPGDALSAYQADVASALQSVLGYQKRTLISQMARINYSYDSRYLLTLTARRDGSSVFGANYKYAFFPSAALGWNIANERFMAHSKLFSNLKLRLSYGSSGNQAVPEYATLAKMDVRNYIDGITTAPGYVPTSLDNPNLHWETTNTANIGVDFGILAGRIQGSIDVYDARTHDLLLKRQLSPVQGINSILQNIGKTRNQGVELALNTQNIQTRDFSWTMNVNVSLNRNKIVELYGDATNDTLNKWFIGHPIDADFGYVYDGVWQMTDDTANSIQGLVHPGYAKVKDLNGDKKINSQDRTILGNSQPDFIWGWGNTFKYKALSLYVFLQGVQGTSQTNSLLSDGGVQSGVRHTTIVKNWWTPTNPTNEHYANVINANQLDAQIVENSSYMRVRDILLSYDLTKQASKVGFGRVRIYVEGRNLFTVTKWTGLDPELTNQTTTPLQKEYLVGLNLSL